MYIGEGREAVAWNQAQTSDMVFTQPVIHDFPRFSMPVALLIGGKDRTAPGANRAPKDVAQRLGNYPELGRQAASMIPRATLVPSPNWVTRLRSKRRRCSARHCCMCSTKPADCCTAWSRYGQLRTKS